MPSVSELLFELELLEPELIFEQELLYALLDALGILFVGIQDELHTMLVHDSPDGQHTTLGSGWASPQRAFSKPELLFERELLLEQELLFEEELLYALLHAPELLFVGIQDELRTI